MNKKYLESSEFYSARFTNFSTIIIIPIFVLLVLIVLFSFVGQRQITVESVGNIEPVGSVPTIQASVNGKITYSALREGKYVAKNQILLKYNNQTSKSKLSLYQSEKKELDEQIDDLELLKSGISVNRDVFNYDDKFGYRSLLKNYLSQRNTYILENNQLTQKQEENKQRRKNNKKTKEDAEITTQIEENNQKLSMLQDKYLEENAQDIIKAKQQLTQVRAQITELNSNLRSYTVKAPKSGILHINDEYTENKYISPGVEVAKIYPIISKQNKVKLKAYISTADISSVKKGQIMQFKVARNVPKPIIISGKINNISVSTTQIDKNTNGYVVSATANLLPAQRKILKYGMSGNISIIIGKISFFNYYKNKLLNGE
ncbi:HlyD family efflux transporter periplasmic adaptor subunit [Lactobacillus sp.]|uniref:HlyD family efflux transporter periplasmic adaptor subunit n=1 Tax=Lactobacillus sp. TaxID=1591 RepID=UPI0019A7CDA2|nr:HlyD family efflux transporter periplasmic adaptor subunit [Lactobacillus sp.]MBD5429942.1 HlyD family efflux transporter periplasmic adaptor subunit [Lactobacillus sp.]